MTNPRPFLSLLIPVLAAVLAFTDGPVGNAAPASSIVFSAPTSIPSIDLRGYGHLSGNYRAILSPTGASLLEIDCDNISKAQLVQAKYLSDLNSLPGTRAVAVPGAPSMSATSVANQGAIAALRSDNRVFIVAAVDPAELPALIASLPTHATLVSTAQVQVPMFLDRWDKYGFRFYYSPWNEPTLPDGAVYDANKEFSWAKREGSGLVFWDDMQTFDTAEGMSNEAWWDWAEKAALKDNVPSAINDSLFANIDRYRNQQEQKMPQYVGDFYTIAGQEIGGYGIVSWNSTTALDEALGLDQSTVRDFRNDPNIVSWMEPHGELNHGPQEIFMEYGPVADGGYRRFLKTKYKSPQAVASRWFGDPNKFNSWSEINVPELASFFGWGPQALDLTGTWRVNYEPFTGADHSLRELDHYDNRAVIDTTPAPNAWFLPSTDDSAWPTVVAPGDDAAVFRPKRPAVYRRAFDVPVSWRSAHPRAWLYIWDLNMGIGATVRTWLNGKELPQETIKFERPHWEALDVSASLVSGRNLLAIRLPKGFIAYRAYLTPTPPSMYPNLGPYRDAQWVDFSDWEQWARTDAVRRGFQMIRQADPNRNITQMSALDYADGVKELCEQYGAEMHDTGYMAGVYSDLETLLMHGVGLPSSAEPGNPPHTLAEYKKMMGLYLSEGLQGVDYFQNIGDVLWDDSIRPYFEQNQNQIHLFGKFHSPDAQVAVLYSNRVDALTGYPWGADTNINMPGGPWLGGYWSWNAGANLRDRCDRDGITERDFDRPLMARYKVVVDTNTSVMSADLLAKIERYVRGGGTFITFSQTGRHSEQHGDTWPISKLTGYRVTHIDRLSLDGDPIETRSLQIAGDQSIFDATALGVLNAVPANGLTLKAAAPDVHNLLLWKDGSVAAGYRQLGKGYIVELGCKWTGTGIPDRIEPQSITPQTRALTMLLTKLMDWRGIPNIPVRIEPQSDDILLRHWISNNGLYDVWTMFNQSDKADYTVDLHFSAQIHPNTALDYDAGQPIAVQTEQSGQSINAIALAPLQTRILLTPRHSLQTASLDWLTLQRQWWRGTAPVPSKPLPAPSHRMSVDLSRDWSWKPLSDSDDVAALAQAHIQNKTWEQRSMGVWSIPDHPDVNHAVYQKTFSVPDNWTTGRVSFWLQSWHAETFLEKGRVWLDGKLVLGWTREGIAGDDFGGALKAGSHHSVTVEIVGKDSQKGTRAMSWLAWQPAPLKSINLAGKWTPSLDFLHDGAPVSLPGSYNAFCLTRRVTVPSSFAGKNVIFSADAPNPMVGVLVNGHWAHRQHHMLGDRWSLNITPWVKPGADNTVRMVTWGGPGTGVVKSIALESYSPSAYP